MPERPLVAALVVTWNSAAVIDGLLGSLDAGFEGVEWQLIVADNDSADDTVARIERWSADNPAKSCQVVHTGGNLGYAAGINAALAKADRYDAALVLNPDIRLHAGSVRRMYDLIDGGTESRASSSTETSKDSSTDSGKRRTGASTPAPAAASARRQSRTGIVVPRIVDEQGNLAHSLRREPTVLRLLGEATLGARAGRLAPLGELVLDESAYARPVVADWATGAAMLISRACLDECGPWDESFFLYSEETEFALRARDHGFLTRLAPQATATHIGGESRVNPELWTLLMRNKIRLYRRRHTLPASVAYWAAALLREAPRAAIGQARSRRAVKALLAPSALIAPGWSAASATPKPKNS